MNKAHDPHEIAEDIRSTIAAMEKDAEKARKSKAYARKILQALTPEACIARLEATFPQNRRQTQAIKSLRTPRAVKPKSVRKKLKAQ